MSENINTLKEEGIIDAGIITSENIIGLVRWFARFRIKIAAIVAVPLVLAVAVYFFSDWVLTLVKLPLEGQPLFFMTPVDGIMAKIKIALFGGIIAGFPIILYLIVSLFSVKLSKKTRRIIYLVIIPFAFIAFAGGISFAYKLLLPTTVSFLLGCGEGVLMPMIGGSEYVSFITFFLILVGLVFELPLVLVALSRIGIIKSKMLMKKRKIAIMTIFIVLAILTPSPDVFTLLIASLPVLFLYELSSWWIFFLEKKDRKREKAI